ncbi:MAG TPA: S-layer glycoprotein [Paenibacillus sp.]|jgi:hypothetical protein
MSNTSYLIKENSYMIVNQGGEKKVMKKILSVALSTAMAFSMFATVAFGADAKLTPEQQFNTLKDAGIVEGFPDGLSHLDRSLTRAELAKIIVKATDLTPVDATSYNDKNYAKHWARTYIEAVTQANIMEGKNLEKKLFDPSGNLSVQELAAVLVRALKLEVPTETNNTATEWAKGYVEAAVKGGYIDAGINYQANASRSQAIVAAYAIYEAAQVPTVASYTVSESGKVVEFTLSNKEVVKVTLEKALEANKETEVKFTHNGHDYTHKVTYVTTAAQKVASVKADNLQEVVVEFDGTVDKKSAENKLNYEVKDLKVDSVKLSEDKKTVTVLLQETNSLPHQKETEIKVKNIKNEDGTKTIEDTVKFTAVDVKIPEIKEVVGLGTSAFKVVFSEPVQKSDVYASSNYKVDGVSISGNVEYSYPNVAIVNAKLPVGDHKLTVSNIRDFSGLKIAPVETSFSIAEDTSAPEVVSIKSNDLKEIEIEFNESVKTWSKVYHGVSGNTGVVTKRDNKLFVTFSNPLAVGENTVYIEGVTDYSGNKANREAKVTPTLDTERPTVEKVSVEQDGTTGYHSLEVQFSKKVKATSAETRSNYTIKNSEGKVVTGTGLDKDGHPYSTPSYDPETNTVTVKLGTKLDTADYTLEVANVVDTAYVANTMLPYSTVFNAKQTLGEAITRVWYKPDGNDNVLYIQYKSNVKTSGEGRADLAEKYEINGKTLSDVSVDVVSGDTVRITSSKNKLNLEFENGALKNNNEIVARLVQDADGNYFKQDGSYTLKATVSQNSKIAVKEAKATSRTEVKVKFDGKLNSYTANDFRVEVAKDFDGTDYKTLAPDSASLSADGLTLTLAFNDGNKLPAYLGTAAKLTVVNSPSTSDAQGISINNAGAALFDEITPEFNDSLSVKTVTGDTYSITLTGNDVIAPINLADFKRVVEVKFGEDVLNIESAVVVAPNQIKIEVILPAVKDTNKYFNIKIDGSANSALKAITDGTNAFAGNTIGGQFGNVWSQN